MTIKTTQAEEQAREIVQASFVAALQAMMQLGVTPDRIVLPWMEQLASLHATVKMRGGKSDKAELCRALDRECDAAVARILKASGQATTAQPLVLQ